MLCREWLSAPDASIAVLEGERGFLIRTWEKCRGNPDGLIEAMSEIDSVDGSASAEVRNAAYRKQVQDIASNRAAYTALIDAIEARTSAQFDAQIANARRPPGSRAFIPEETDDSLPGHLARALIPSLNRIPDRFAADRAAIHLLGLHAAIHRYLWEHDRLPDTLSALRARDLDLDPFSGKPFDYKRVGAREYELSSAGPWKTDDNGRPLPPGTRVPLFLPPRPK